MWFKSLNVLATALLATVCYGDVVQAPAAPEAPAAPQEPAGRTKTKHLKIYAPSAGGAYLGVEPRDITSDRVGALKLNESRGVEVMMVDRDSPGGKAGLKEHDVILGLNGKSVSNVEQLRSLLRSTTPGTTVPLAINRAGQAMTLNVELGKRPDMLAAMPQIPPMPQLDIDVPNVIVLQSSSRNGILVEDLTSQLADFFGVKNGGVLVRSVDRGSAGDTAGLKAGDVIVKVANQPISCSNDWRRAMHGQRGSVQLGVIRDKREQGVTIKLPEKNPESSFRIDSEDFRKGIEDLRSEIERQKPELQKQMAMARTEAQKAFREHQRELEGIMTKMRSEDFKREMEKAQKALDEALQNMEWE